MTAFRVTVHTSASAATSHPHAVVAIPANNEAGRIEACLAALAVQRDIFGAPLPAGAFDILVFANNCIDDTIDIVERTAQGSPHPVSVVSELLEPEKSNAGWARKRAMDLAAARLMHAGRHEGVILTTDADSLVSPTWIDATRRAFKADVDAVAGYVDAHPLEILRLGTDFLNRSRLEDSYLRLTAEIYALCDPRPHDPWPNHRVSSGASLAVRLAAYLSIGGLPPVPVGEDAALVSALERAGYRVRHAMDVCVSTSCRFDGRATGGAADTMRHRHAVADAPCDSEIEPALFVLRRALGRRLARRFHDERAFRPWEDRPRAIGLRRELADVFSTMTGDAGFEEVWPLISAACPSLRFGRRLRPADLAGEIERARGLIRMLKRSRADASTDGRGDRRDRSGSREPEAA